MYKTTLEIEQLPEGPFLATGPDLPGLVVQGDSVQEVLRLVPDLAHDLIAVMIETNQQLPSAIETVTAPGRVSQEETWGPGRSSSPKPKAN